MKNLFRFLSIFLLFSLCYAGTIDPSTPDSKYIEYGAKFHSVVKICGFHKDGTLFCASATLIDDHNFLTAAHVVDNANICFITVGEKTFDIDVKYIVVNENHKDKINSGDIAIGYSEKPFGLKHYPKMYENNDEEGKVCSIAGYGLTGTFSTGIEKADNKKRAGSNIIDYADNNLLVCSPSKKGERGFTSLEFMIGSGDSGGGLFIDGKLAGINSCVMAVGRSPKSKYGEESGHTRISKFVDWINEHKKKME
jgi:hypothetical protein